MVFHNNCLLCHSLEPGQNGHGPSLAINCIRLSPRVATSRMLRRAIVNSDGCRVLGTYCGGMVSGCRGPI